MSAQAWSEPGKLIATAQRLDPEYFDPRAVTVAAELARRGARMLGGYVNGAWRGISPTYDAEGSIRVVKTANVQRFEISASPAEYVAQDESAMSARIPRGSLLITSTGVGSAGRTFAFFGDDIFLVADGHVTVLPIRCPPTDGAYICAFLQSPVGRQQVIRLHRGSSRQIEIYPEDLLTVPIPWASPEVRRRIADQWLSAVASIEASRTCVRSAEAVIEGFVGLSETDLDGVAQASWDVMTDALYKDLRLDPEYDAPKIRVLRRALTRAGAVQMSDVILEVDKGIQPESYDPDGVVIVVKSKDVDYPDFDLARCERAYVDCVECLKSNDVLINMTGEGTLGRAAVMPESDDPDIRAVAAVDLAVVKLDLRLIMPQYLALFLNSWMGRQQTRSLQTGSSGQQHLYPAHFSEVLIPIRRNFDGSVDLAWQREIVDLAEQRGIASRRAAETGDKLDRWFMDDIVIPVDLGTIPY
jgi:hypothetical protein